MNKNSFQNLVQGDYGRKIAYTSETKIDINNVRKVANIGIKVMNKNADAIRYLKAYELGDQPVLYRTKTARDDINNPIVENHAYELVQFEVGQSYGEPVQCVSLKNDERVNKNVDVLNDYYRGIDKQATDIEVGEWVSTVGHGYKAIIRKPMMRYLSDLFHVTRIQQQLFIPSLPKNLCLPFRNLSMMKAKLLIWLGQIHMNTVSSRKA